MRLKRLVWLLAAAALLVAAATAQGDVDLEADPLAGLDLGGMNVGGLDVGGERGRGDVGGAGPGRGLNRRMLA